MKLASSLLKEIAHRIFHVGELTSSSCNEWQWQDRGGMRHQYSGLCEIFVYVFVFVTYIINICLFNFFFFLVEFYLLSLLTNFLNI